MGLECVVSEDTPEHRNEEKNKEEHRARQDEKNRF